MQFQLIIHKLIVNSKQDLQGNVLSIKVSIGNIQFVTDEVHKQKNIYPFLQKNSFIVNKGQNYDSTLINFQVLEKGQVRGHKMIFVKSVMNEGMQEEEIKLNCLNNIITSQLLFTLNVKVQDGKGSRIFLSKQKIRQDKQIKQIKQEEGKLQILKMGLLMHKFANRLGPALKIYKGLSDIINWKNKVTTLIVLIVLSLIIINIRIALISIGVLLLLGRKNLIGMFQNMHEKSISQRLVIPKQNFIFLQDLMILYCNLYDKIEDIVTNDDKTTLISIIENFCLVGITMSIGLIFLNFNSVVVIALWLGFLLTSSYGNTFIQTIEPGIKYLNNFLFTFSSIIASQQKNKTEIVKQFYIYEYQRWWVGREWIQCSELKWSDQDWFVEMSPQRQPPQGWMWKQSWKIYVGSSTDANGFQYANDFDRKFKNEKTLKTLRRRKWKRKCLIIDSENK